jgi:hypothetical protein
MRASFIVSKLSTNRLSASRPLILKRLGEEKIYEINLLEAMMLLKRAWEKVTAETIWNCWHHTSIIPKDTDEWEDIFINEDTPSNDDNRMVMDVDVDVDPDVTLPPAWELMLKFASSETMTLPQLET